MPLTELNTTGFRGSVQNIGTSRKSDLSWDGTNSIGFSGLPGGHREQNGTFQVRSMRVFGGPKGLIDICIPVRRELEGVL